jgi:VCBS repeat-containing protein
VLDNDADIDSPMLTAVLVEGPQHGTLTLAPDGGFLYTPNADYFGSDSFTYRASDGHLDSNLALVTLTIQPVNDAPVATDDAYTLDEDTPLNVPMAGVLGNDTDIDSPALTVALVDGPQHGTLTLAPDGGFLYTPNADYFGNDSFTYRASDGQLDSNLALVTLTIQPVNDAPVATDDAYTLDEDTPLSISAAGVLGNDTDIDSPTLTAALVDAPQHGTLSLAADGSFLYTPNADYFGRDSFTYRANNGQLDSNLALVTLTIQPVNDVPVATDDAYTLEEDTPLSIAVSGVLGNDSDIDSPTLTAVLAEGPQHGTLAVAGDGGFLYTPNADYFGSDSFTYRANDGQLDSNLALVTLTIQPVNDAPSIDPIANQTVDEGSPLSFIVSASDVENDALSFGLDSAPLGAAIDAASGLFSWTPGDGPVSAPIVVRATDAAGAFSTTAFDVSVLNVAPTLLLSGAASIGLGQPYTLDLSASDPGQDSISGWQIHWGDGSSEDITGNPASVTHTYLSSGVMSFTATATDEDGSYAANSLQVQVAAPEALQVSALTPTASGFQVRFNRAIDPSALNLYDSEAAQLGAPDLTLVGFAGGPVKGSLIVDADQRGLSFLRSGDILAPDTYTIRLESGANAFKDLAGGSLDGNGDGTAGDAFQSSFTVAATGPTLSLPDLMRGPGQSVDLTAPSQNGFLPLYLSDGAGVTDVEFTLHYDPTSLVVQGVSAGADLPATATIERLPTADGLLKVRISSPTALAAGKVELLHIAAMVPTTAAYGAKHLLDLDEVRVNGQTATADDALQLVAYLGDTSGDASYSTLDGQRIQRVLVKLDSGFAAYANVDPLIVADTNANGYLSSIDASRVFQEVSYLTGASTLDRLELPPIPAGIGPLSLAGPDPLVDIPIDARGEAGELITVPVRIDTAAGLESVQLQIGYDASRFDLVEVRRGSLSGDFGWFITGQEAGRIRVDMTRLNALQGGSGTLLDIDLRIKPDALPGVTAVDLQYARLNDGRLTLGVLPQVGADASDGRITILGKTLEPVPPSSTALRDAHLPSTLLQRQRQWQPTQQARFDGASQASSTAGDSVPSLPVIDFGSSFSLPAVASDGLAADGKSKAWLQDYLGNAGQARKASPNAGLKVSLPVAASGAGVASRGVLRP